VPITNNNVIITAGTNTGTRIVDGILDSVCMIKLRFGFRRITWVMQYENERP
jgi:hypothetical protein